MKPRNHRYWLLAFVACGVAAGALICLKDGLGGRVMVGAVVLWGLVSWLALWLVGRLGK